MSSGDIITHKNNAGYFIQSISLVSRMQTYTKNSKTSKSPTYIMSIFFSVMKLKVIFLSPAPNQFWLSKLNPKQAGWCSVVLLCTQWWHIWAPHQIFEKDIVEKNLHTQWGDKSKGMTIPSSIPMTWFLLTSSDSNLLWYSLWKKILDVQPNSRH